MLVTPNMSSDSNLTAWGDLQMKARSRAAHSAVDWLYTVITSVAAAEQACLQPSPELAWTLLLHNQVKSDYILWACNI